LFKSWTQSEASKRQHLGKLKISEEGGAKKGGRGQLLEANAHSTGITRKNAEKKFRETL